MIGILYADRLQLLQCCESRRRGAGSPPVPSNPVTRATDSTCTCMWPNGRATSPISRALIRAPRRIARDFASRRRAQRPECQQTAISHAWQGFMPCLLVHTGDVGPTRTSVRLDAQQPSAKTRTSFSKAIDEGGTIVRVGVKIVCASSRPCPIVRRDPYSAYSGRLRRVVAACMQRMTAGDTTDTPPTAARHACPQPRSCTCCKSDDSGSCDPTRG